ncbi:MAG TPA: hypothetical protein VGE01_12305 [Fimbriimonas sp.]
MASGAPVSDREPMAAHPPVARWYSHAPADSMQISWREVLWVFSPAVYVALVGSLTVLAGLPLLALLLAAPGFFLLYGIFSMILKDRRSLATRKDLSLLEDEKAWLVQIWILQNGIRTGSDRGVAWFEEGAMGFFGHRTSFVLNTTHIDPSQASRTRLYGLTDERTGRYTLSLRAPVDRNRWLRRNVYLQIAVLQAKPADACRPEKEFDEGIRRFLEESPAPVAQFPPLVIGPGSVNGSMLRAIGSFPSCVLLGVILLWHLGAIVSGRELWGGPGWLWALVLAGAGTALWYSRMAKRQLEVLRSLQRDELWEGAPPAKGLWIFPFEWRAEGMLALGPVLLLFYLVFAVGKMILGAAITISSLALWLPIWIFLCVWTAAGIYLLSVLLRRRIPSRLD